VADTSTASPARAVARGSLLAPVLLLNLSAVLWGSSFVFAKDLVAGHRPLSVLAFRFLLAAVAMTLARPRALRGLPRSIWWQSAGIGAFYALAQVPHYFGLQTTPASTAGFLVGTYVVVTPLLGFLLLRRRSSPATLVGVAVTVLGLAVFSWQNTSFGVGEILCLVAAVLYALQVLSASVWSTVGTAWAMTTIEMITMAVVMTLAAGVQGLDVPTAGHDWLMIGYLALMSGVVGVGLQTWAQARLTATHASVIMSSEPLWAAVMAVLIAGEAVTARLLVGGALLLAANVLTALSHRSGARRTVAAD
jgi:drug/metabolite transporter (DMT)-like permease